MSATVSRWRRARGLSVVLMGAACFVAPFLLGKAALSAIGVLMIVSGVLELIETFSVADSAGQRSTYLGGILSIVAGLLLLNEPIVVLRGLIVLLGITFLLDGTSKVIASIKARLFRQTAASRLARGAMDLALGAVLLLPWNYPRIIVVGAVIGIRMVMSGWAMLINREPPPSMVERLAAGEYPDTGLNVPAHAHFAALSAEMENEDRARRRFDTYWCWTFIITFFAIHAGRMNATLTLGGMVSPLVAALGDIGTALVLAFGIVLPARLLWRKVTRPFERTAWAKELASFDDGAKPGWLGSLRSRWLTGRQRASWRFAQIRYSLRAAMRWGLRVGLPLAAILIALNPIWGFSWHFNSENWATEIWNRWAEARTDTWREAMTRAVRDTYPVDRLPNELLFRIEPEGLAGGGDFSFIVIGDTGEGDGSQWCLKDRYEEIGRREDCKFLVLSSDVIYPTGAMFDYEPKFYLPFKGFTKPIYAIPGNHDWYDALEGFAANFLEADAARASMKARITVDKRVTTTTDRHIEDLIVEGARLRTHYGVRNGVQRGPFFDIQTDRFALIAADTGVARSLDPIEELWLKAVLEKSKGKCIMVVLGHPLYAGGRYQGDDDEAFAAIHKLLREHKVDIVMAGDTHYFEHYRETSPVEGGSHTALHFVNGGGGAYMSIGTPLDWPETPAVPDCAYFPSKEIVYSKLDRETPTWKRPIWYWTKKYKAWPFTAEFLSGAFDYNRTPFLQSFVEVKVERSANRVRLALHSAAGPVRWKDLDAIGSARPAGASDSAVVEFVVPLPK